MTLVIGLTGGIASGKSMVAEMFAAKGITIIDTDRIARDLVAPHSDILKTIVAHIGDGILSKNGHLNRRTLRTHIFNHANDKIWLEALLHPRIRAITNEQITKASSPYCIVVIPLLVETTPNPRINRVLLVDTSVETQLARLMVRDTLTKEEANKMIVQQATREARLAHADDVIHNDHHPEHVQQSVDALHARYLALTHQQE